jgi:hypothetical protein
MTAGVQSVEPAVAYLQAPPSSPSTDGKGTTNGTGAAPNGSASEFQNELALQNTGAPEKKTSSRPGTGSAKAGNKVNARPDDAKVADATPAAVTPVIVVEPQKPILPTTLVPGAPDEHTDELSENEAGQDKAIDLHARPVNISRVQISRVQTGQDKIGPKDARRTQSDIPTPKDTTSSKESWGVAAPIDPANVPVPVIVEFRHPHAAPPKNESTADPSPVGQTPLVLDEPHRQVPPDSPPESKNQQASPDELKVPELSPIEPTAVEPAPVEPTPAEAAQKVVDSEPSVPAALAFAARLTPVKPEQNGTGPDNQVKPPTGATTTAQIRIPIRYAATAQIIQRAESKSEGDLDFHVDPTKNAGPALDRPARPDLALPSAAATTEKAGGSQVSQTPEPVPTARMERVIEPPAASPTSSHDIRVRVPDNNGGSTQVRFLESGGEVRVSVRTTDAGLAQNLRSHLNDLSQHLAEGGIPAEIWKPASSAASSQNDQHQPDHEGRDSSGQDSGGRSGSQDDPQDPQQKRPAWLEEMEASLLGANA